jgi:hypothetical protein
MTREEACAERYRYIDSSGNIRWADSILQVPQRYRDQVTQPTPAPDEKTYKWLLDQKRKQDQEKKKREQEEERQQREEEKRVKAEERKKELEKKKRKKAQPQEEE